ncbi:SAM-dependent methyltransferase [Reichenbachiella agarivorans]|uniref:SAM-dependent methyltransferase n=1 Tax=Reichenbachiella agarivorans TaxID=2979464 RepID=A0ABY6CPA9_9BACT|nr:SAM-dependent methyltransferase [Reichenbachiella agarivorans]UXP32347.1 SAM-dependent methyltransferase [Reichenbachiella agarivorans]
MKDLHGQAILDYYKKEESSLLLLHNSYGEPEEMPVEVFFREPEDFSELENCAIAHCYRKVLDLGAGAGAHSLLLQALDFEVTALDNSPGCVETMRQSGIQHIVDTDYRIHKAQYETVLLLMNGLGIAGKLSEVKSLLLHCKSLLVEGGNIILDSSDISYLYEEGLEMPKDYYGEIRYRYEYKGEMGEWFDWVYVDQNTLTQIVHDCGMEIEILMTDENDQYLAKIF